MPEESNQSKARTALLEKIAALTPNVTNPLQILQLAEAYAWASNTNQPHGGSAVSAE